MKKTAIITGITGQDGSYLAKLLLEKNYQVVGLLRHGSDSDCSKHRFLNIFDQILYDRCDICSAQEVEKIFIKYQPDEVYNLAAQSSVGQSFNKPIDTLSFNILSVVTILETIKKVNKKIKFYQASSSEMIGSANNLPFTEKSILHPVSPYGISKASAHWITVNYRESFGLFTTSGILFNHESVLRGNNFIIKKIIRDSFLIKNGKKENLEVGNIEIKRDFGYAPKYVEAMYLMMQLDKPDDYIISSGRSYSLKEIIHYVFDKLSISRDKIKINEKFFRPNEIKDIYGDSSKANNVLNWNYDMDFFDVLDILIEEEQTIYE